MNTNENGYLNDPNAFIFTLVNPMNKPHKLKIVFKYYSNAIHKNILTFGGGHDIKIVPNSNSIKSSYVYSHSYERPDGYSPYFFNGEQYFYTSEIEIFKIDFDSKILTTNKEKELLLELCDLDNNFLDLVYRGSRDGFGASDFHSHADGIRNTLVIIKTDNDYVLGGYTEEAWSSNITGVYVPDPYAFIFTFTNPSNLRYKMGIKYPLRAIYNSANKGPTFGRDLQISDSSNTKQSNMLFNSDYSSYGGRSGLTASRYYNGKWSNNFLLKEIEVYRTIPNNLKFESKILSDKDQIDLLKLVGFESRRFKLVYRLADGRFNEKCRGIKNTLSIIKTKQGYVLGGYTNTAWDSGYSKDEGAFLYTLKNPTNNQTKMQIIEAILAIYASSSTYSSYGPTYGSRDIRTYWSSKYMAINFSSYHTPYGLGNSEAKILMLGLDRLRYDLDEIEVFETFEN